MINTRFLGVIIRLSPSVNRSSLATWKLTRRRRRTRPTGRYRPRVLALLLSHWSRALWRPSALRLETSRAPFRMERGVSHSAACSHAAALLASCLNTYPALVIWRSGRRGRFLPQAPLDLINHVLHARRFGQARKTADDTVVFFDPRFAHRRGQEHNGRRVQ